MYVKLHNIDPNFFPILSSSTKTIPILGISIPHDAEKSEIPLKTNIQKSLTQTPIGVIKRCRKVYVNPTLDKKKVAPIVHKPGGGTQHGLVKNPEEEQRRNRGGGDCRIEEKRDCGGGKSRNGVTKKVHTKCSTKWARYRGRIPAMLEALETVGDLDEAFKPWEERLSNKERTIILKEQSGWERAREIFEWFKRKGCYEVNVIHYNIMLNVLGKARQWSEVERLWDEMGRRSIKPKNSTYGTLIDVFSKGGLRQKALHWLNLMNEQGMKPDEVTMGIVIQMYKKAGEFKTAEEYFKNWSLGRHVTNDRGTSTSTIRAAVNGDSQGHLCLSSCTYNNLIDTYGKGGKLKDAYKTLELMLGEGYVPNIVTYNTLIHTFGNNGQLDKVALLMPTMEELGCLPNTRTYNILISLHAKHDNIELAANYFKKMKEASLEPDPVSYRTLIYAFSIRHMVGEVEELVAEMDKRCLDIDEFTQSAVTRMYIEAGMLKKSWLWFKRFHLEGKMTSQCYAANVDAFGERGHVLEAEEVFHCCLQGKKPTVLEFNVMIKAYGINKRYDEACRLLDSMEDHGVVPDKCSYSSLIQMLASADLPLQAISYVRKMQEAGLMIDCIPYCAVISSFAKIGHLEMAVGVFEEMVRHNVQPDVVVYGVLINAFADIGSVEEALGYLNAMRDAGLPMNAVICNSLIKLYTKLGCLKEAQEVYRLLQSLDRGPDLYSSNCMIDLYSEESMVPEAEDIFEKLKRKGDANEFSYAMMLCMYKRIGRFDEANRIAQKMKELGLLTNLLSYNHVLGLYASEGRLKEAVASFREMVRCSIQPDDSTFRSLGVVLVKCGVSKKAVSKLEVTWKKDGQNGLKEWMSTLDYVVGTFDIDAY